MEQTFAGEDGSAALTSLELAEKKQAVLFTKRVVELGNALTRSGVPLDIIRRASAGSQHLML